MSWASTELYYRHLNKGVQKRLGTACSAPILMESLNYCDLELRWNYGDRCVIPQFAWAMAACYG